MINVILAFMIIISFLGAVILHELGHALVATWLGDPTPQADARVASFPVVRQQHLPVDAVLSAFKVAHA